MRILTLSDYLKQQYGQKIYKISLSSGCTCPNRDGTLGMGGCTFCSAGGSGEFAQPVADEQAIDWEIEQAIHLVKAKLPKGQSSEDRKFIAYFQSYTNTYGDAERLTRLYRKVISRPDIVALSLGTRPDCIGETQLRMLSELNRIKPVWVELGLQTIHNATAERIHRGYPTEEFKTCYDRLKSMGMTVIVHVILGLPGESREDMLDTICYLANLQPSVDGIKLQMLNILEGSVLGEEYKQKPFAQMTMEEYCELVVQCLQILPENVVIHRMTGDGPRKLLLSPGWVTDKKRVLNMLRKKIRDAKETERDDAVI